LLASINGCLGPHHAPANEIVIGSLHCCAEGVSHRPRKSDQANRDKEH
jgi:hypothetical protein